MTTEHIIIGILLILWLMERISVLSLMHTLNATRAEQTKGLQRQEQRRGGLVTTSFPDSSPAAATRMAEGNGEAEALMTDDEYVNLSGQVAAGAGKWL